MNLKPPPDPWPYGSVEEWQRYRDGLEGLPGAAHLRVAADRELARIGRCSLKQEPRRYEVVPARPGDGYGRRAGG